jgi:hypothetical protein
MQVYIIQTKIKLIIRSHIVMMDDTIYKEKLLLEIRRNYLNYNEDNLKSIRIEL